MAITAETRKDIIELVVTALNVAPGTTLLNELVAIVNGGGTLADVAANIAASTAFTSKYPAFQTAEEFAAEWLSNLIPEASAAALAEATTAVVGVVNAGTSAADMLIQAQTFLSAAAETDASFGTSAANFNNKVEVATHHTVTLEQAASSATAISAVTSDDATVEAGKTALGGGASAGGATFTATTGTDAVVGTTGNDVINAAAGTLNAGDTINGGDGTDTLNVTWTGTGPAQSASTLSNVEILNLTASPNPASLSLTGVTGITEINNVSSANGATVTVSGVGAPVNSTLTGGQAATTIGYTTAVTASTATSDKSTLTLAGTSLGASYTATGIEEVTVNSTKAANTLSSLGVSSATKVTVTGDQALTINGTVGGSKLASIDASAFTGKTLSLTAGAGAAGSASKGVTVTLPTADSVTSTVTTGGEKDTITLGAGGATVTAGGDNDTITSGAGTNTIMGGAGNDSIKLSGTKDTLRYAETGTANADTVEGFSSSSVIAVNLGTAQTSTASAEVDSDFGVVQTGATSPTIGNVDGKGTGTAIAFQGVSPTATTTVNPVAATSNVLALNGAFTDGTAAGVVTALGTSATTAIATATASKFLVVTYSVGNIAQVWAYNGDDDADTDIDASELALVATLSGVTQNSLTAANFATYLTASTSSGTVSNSGQTINLTTPLNLVQSTANANGHFLTAANDTINVATGMLPTGATTATMGLTVIDPEGANDADVLNATVLNNSWDSGTLISNVETVNLEFLTADNGFAMSSILPGTDTLGISGLSTTGTITNVISGTTFSLGSSYTKQVAITPTAATDDFSLTVNGTHATLAGAVASGANAENFISTSVMDDLTINVAANAAIELDTTAGTDFNELIIKGSKNLTIYDDNAGFGAAKITATDLGFTGKLTLALVDAGAALDFTAGGVASAGAIDAVDISAAGGSPVITLPAVTGGGSFTVSHSPTAAASSTAITVNQAGASASDSLTVAFGSKSDGNTGAITATSTETLTISAGGASTTTDTIGGNIVIATGAGTQTVNISGAGGVTVTGSINADTINTSGVGKAVSIGDLVNATGTTTFTGGAGNTTISAASGNVPTTVTTGAGNDNITTGTADDTISVGSGTNTVISGNGTDTITGGSGVDTITGGGGADTITTGGGADVLVYTTIADSSSATVGNFDTIKDINFGTDKIDVTNVPAAVVATASGSISAGSFNADVDAILTTGTANHVQIVTANAGDLNGRSFLIQDTDGDGTFDATTELIIEVTGSTGTLATTTFQ